MYYAFRDAFGFKDVVEDSKATLRGEGMDYRQFEPSEGHIHQGIGRDRRIKAGLRYSKGGKGKYWLPKPNQGTHAPGLIGRGVDRAIGRVVGRDQGEEVHAPLLADETVHLARDLEEEEEEEGSLWKEPDVEGDGYELPFGDLDAGDDELFAHSKKYVFGDYNYPCIDISSEAARGTMWDEEERILRDERGAWFSSLRGAKGRKAVDLRDGPAWEGYGAVASHPPRGGNRERTGMEGNDGVDAWREERIIDLSAERTRAPGQGDVRLKWTKTRPLLRPNSTLPVVRTRNGDTDDDFTNAGRPGRPSTSARSFPSSSSASYKQRESPKQGLLPPDAVDLVVEDSHAAERERTRERRKGEPAARGTGSGLRKVYRREFVVAREEEEEGMNVGVVDGGESMVEVEAEAEAEVEGGSEDEGEVRQRLDEDGHMWLDDGGGQEDAVVARAETPPLHARVIGGVPGDDVENPWAS